MKQYIIVGITALVIGSVGTYFFFPKIVTKTVTIEKEKLVIKDGHVIVNKGNLKLLPDGTMIANGDFKFDFGSYNSNNQSSVTTTQSALKLARIGLIVNPLEPLKEFGLSYSTPFIFGTELQGIVLQREFKEVKVLLGVNIPL